MSILIRGASLPKSCNECKLDLRTDICQAFCEWNAEHSYSIMATDRLPDCPLSEAPEPCEDTISRQAAIDAIKSEQAYYSLEDGAEIFFEYNHAIKALKNLPSAQPEYYDYSDIDLVWKYYAEEQDINLTDGAKQLKDAMWVGYRKGKQDAWPQWIPCSERLPKEDGQYFITEKDTFGDYLYVSIANYGVPCMPMNKGKGRGWFITDSEGDYYCDMNHVLAWMPLPEPYKERREE